MKNGRTINTPEVRDDPVMICTGCGRGFLVSPGSKLDPVPVWFTSFSRSEGSCLGRIMMADRRMQIHNIDQWELSNAKDAEQD